MACRVKSGKEELLGTDVRVTTPGALRTAAQSIVLVLQKHIFYKLLIMNYSNEYSFLGSEITQYTGSSVELTLWL